MNSDQCFLCLHWRSYHDADSCDKCKCSGFAEPGDGCPFEWEYSDFNITVVEAATGKVIAKCRNEGSATAFISMKTQGRYDKLTKERGDD
jgi:hypothetical protein